MAMKGPLNDFLIKVRNPRADALQADVRNIEQLHAHLPRIGLRADAGA